MKFKIHKLSFKYLITFSLCIMIPVTLTVVGINLVYIRSQQNLYHVQMQETVNQMSQNISNEVISLSILSSALSHNKEFLKHCVEYSKEKDKEKLYDLYNLIDLELSRLFLYTNKVGFITVYINGKPPFMYKNSPLFTNVGKPPIIDQVFLDNLEETPRRLKLFDNLFTIIDKTPHLSFALDLKGTTHYEFIDKIVFSYPINLLMDITKNSSLDQFLYITSNLGDVILDPNGHNLSNDLNNKRKNSVIDKKNWILLDSAILSTTWTLTQSLNLDKHTKSLFAIQRIFIIIISGLILLFLLYSLLFFNSLINPLNGLIEKMKLVESGDYTTQAPEPKEFEMRRLIHSFNSMVKKIHLLTKGKEKNEKEKSRLELQALQYQINPHFIGNTLNSIRLMAVVNKNDNIKNMTASLMKLVNDSFRNDGNKTTIKDEIKLLKSYIHIMKVRFSTPIDLKTNIDIDLESLTILKMLLQPIVENSIVHGFVDSKVRDIILIRVKKHNENILIDIIDNGVGISNNQHQQNRGSFTHIGLKNVDRRIKLNYGDEFGIRTSSKTNCYTKVSVLLPYKGETID
ncbi:MAG: histidine kinase [Spirochaetaceae bacterium]